MSESGIKSQLVGRVTFVKVDGAAPATYIGMVKGFTDTEVILDDATINDVPCAPNFHVLLEGITDVKPST
ncbi:hypothetical protein ACFL0L_03780 [Patescibacteria group bacterium]